MEVAPLCMITPQESESMIIEQNKKIYILNLIKKEDNIILSILDKDNFININYTKKLSFQEIKQLHKLFSILNSCNEFSEYIKTALEKKKINIKKEDQKLILIISVEYLFKNNIIEIPLIEQKINLQDSFKEVYQEISLIKEEIKKLKENMADKNDNNIKMILDKQNGEIIKLKDENKKLKEEINELLNFKDEVKSKIEKHEKENKKLIEEIKILRSSYQELKENIIIKQNNNNETKEKKDIRINSVIMKNEEFDMIKKEIEKKINKKIKEIRKLYQATIDGGDTINFHSKCDNIPYTLVGILN